MVVVVNKIQLSDKIHNHKYIEDDSSMDSLLQILFYLLVNTLILFAYDILVYFTTHGSEVADFFYLLLKYFTEALFSWYCNTDRTKQIFSIQYHLIGLSVHCELNTESVE